MPSRINDSGVVMQYWSGHRLQWLALLFGLLFSATAGAADYVQSETTAPANVEDLSTPLDLALEAKEKAVVSILLPGLKEKLRNAPIWLRNSSLDVNIRAYEFKRVNRNESINQALAIGGEITATSGRIAGIARLVLSYYYSGGLYAPEDYGGTGLLAPDQQDLAALGKAYLLLGEPNRIAARLYRQELDLPYLNKDDSRMIPNHHEGYLLGRKGSSQDFVLGHVTKMKRKDSETFVPMSVLAGAPGTDKGVTTAGIKVQLPADINFGGFNFYGWDTFNTAYLEVNWVEPMMRKYGVKGGFQFTDQRSVGDELVGSFSTQSYGLTLAGGRHGRILTLAYNQVGNGGIIRDPWGGTPLYNSMMLESFKRAGEKSFRLGLSLSGEPYGHGAWSGFANIVTGWDAINADSRETLPDVTEYDLTIDYKPRFTQRAAGYWLRLRGAYADFDDDTERWNVRFILNVPMSLL